MAKKTVVSETGGLVAQVDFSEKLLKLIEAEAPKNHKGELQRPFKGWAAELRESIERGRQWIESCKRKESSDGTG